MSCNSCGCNTNPCCCPPNGGVPYQIPGGQGPQGPQGIQGNPGPPGPAGVGSDPAYGQLYSTTDQIVAPDAPVVWDGIQNEINGSLPLPTRLRVTEPGRYQITWAVTVPIPIAP